jgi:hypothetical protein
MNAAAVFISQPTAEKSPVNFLLFTESMKSARAVVVDAGVVSLRLHDHVRFHPILIRAVQQADDVALGNGNTHARHG